MQTILFDLDGTLVDSAPDLLDALNDTLVERGLPVPENSRALTEAAGEGAMALLRAGLAPGVAGERLLEELQPVFLAFSARRAGRRGRPFPRVTEILSLLRMRGIRAGVCTNRTEDSALELLGRTGLLPLLDTVTGRGDKPKPHPEPVLRALDVLGARAGESIFLGDRPEDILAARAAGVGTVLLAGYGYGALPARPDADGVLGTFAAILDWLPSPGDTSLPDGRTGTSALPHLRTGSGDEDART